MSIKLYMDFMSQPSRAVYSYFLLTKIPFEIIETRIAKFENLTPTFRNLNPLTTVPLIHDPNTNISLSQSHSIMRYLSHKAPSSCTSWYPINTPTKTCKIDQYLDFHHTHTRKCHYYVINSVFHGKVQGKTDRLFDRSKSRKDVEDVLGKIEECFFRQKEWVVGQGTTIADLSAFFQVEFLVLTGENFQNWPILKQWIHRMRQIKEIQQANHIFTTKILPRVRQNQPTQIK